MFEQRHGLKRMPAGCCWLAQQHWVDRLLWVAAALHVHMYISGTCRLGQDLHAVHLDEMGVETSLISEPCGPNWTALNHGCHCCCCAPPEECIDSALMGEAAEPCVTACSWLPAVRACVTGTDHFHSSKLGCVSSCIATARAPIWPTFGQIG